MPHKLFNSSQIKSSMVFHPCMCMCISMMYSLPVPRLNNTRDLKAVFTHMSADGILINLNKCLFATSSLNFLGHHIDHHGISPVAEKVTHNLILSSNSNVSSASSTSTTILSLTAPGPASSIILHNLHPPFVTFTVWTMSLLMHYPELKSMLSFLSSHELPNSHPV